jgi:DNA helicase-2/ATP-dependent DNA helicase PcrA
VSLTEERTRRFVEFFSAYDEQCQREGTVDFAELLLRAYELLKRNEVLRAHYAERFRHILIDEFQDTNRLQYRWLKLLAGKESRLFAVGDDDQSIYAFRGAHSANMGTVRARVRHRARHSPGAELPLARQHPRRGERIDREQPQAPRQEPVDRERQGRPAARLRRRLGHRGGALHRRRGQGAAARRASPRPDRRAVPVERAVARHRARALQQLDPVPRVRRACAFSSAPRSSMRSPTCGWSRFPTTTARSCAFANFPPRGIGTRTIEQVQDAAKAGGTSLLAAAAALTGRAAPALAQFRALIERLKAECAGLPLAECVEHVVAGSGLIEHYKAERDGAERVENLGELVNAAASFTEEEREVESGAEVDELSAFLAHAALEAGEHQAGEGQDALQLMTVHSAKGLEFNAVFLSGLEEGLFPHEQAFVERDGLEEERRLAYVAITRARERLYLSHAQTRMLHGQTRYSLASRFLAEIPEELKKWLTPRISERRSALGAAASWQVPRKKEERLAFSSDRRVFASGRTWCTPSSGRRDHRCGRAGRGCARAGEFRSPGRQVARGRGSEAAGCLIG